MKLDELYAKICQLPIDEQMQFYEWAKEFIKEVEEQIKKRKEEEHEKL